jgi:S-adenosyl-L-methionine hydrolase (adenosine-forming)
VERNLAGPIITLTTDFGLEDHLVGTMKGVILKINPEARIVDITHGVAAYDLLDAAITIGQAYRYYPARTIHVVVVDPGVGTLRRPLLVSAAEQYFIAPDNGVLSLVYEREPAVVVRHVTAGQYFLAPTSQTFHGRDIFSPVAAWLSRTWQQENFGPEVSDYARLSLPQPRTEKNAVKGVILRADRFGNLLTNLTPENVPLLRGRETRFRLRAGAAEITRLAETFAEGPGDEPALVLGSSGFYEIFIHRGDAARKLALGPGSEITLEFV